MQPLTQYYVRARHRSSGGKVSDWSAGSSFATKQAGISGTEQAKLVANDAQGYDYSGYSVSLSGDGNTALIGAYHNTGTYNAQGAAYVFTRTGSTWTQQSKLLASDPAASDGFGFGLILSADGNTALIGAYTKTGTMGSNQGAAYVFTRSGTTWTQQAKLLQGDPGKNSYFGVSVSLSGDGNTSIVGAYGTGSSPNSGSAYIFTRSGSTWTQQSKLVLSDGFGGDYFGWSVSLSSDGNMALIGAYGKKTIYNGQGSAYVFTRSGSTWTQQAKLTHSDPAANDFLGISVSLSSDGNTALIGAYQKTGTYSQQGAAYVFTRSGSTWTQQAKVLAGDPAASDGFGSSVSLSGDGDTALIGAYRKTGSGGSNQGAVYVFTRTGSIWTQQVKLLASDPAASGYFGQSVSLSGNKNVALIGAYGKNSYKGTTYVFI